jgi:prolipoprotein diacylglyceryltransferase
VLIRFGKKWRDGSIFYIYIAGYSAARFIIEGIRIDSAHDFLGLRVNQWTSIFIFILGLALFYRNQGKKQVNISPEN